MTRIEFEWNIGSEVEVSGGFDHAPSEKRLFKLTTKGLAEAVTTGLQLSLGGLALTCRDVPEASITFIAGIVLLEITKDSID